MPVHDTIHGDINNIHPWDKKPVAHRLASFALKNDYGKDVSFTGPEFKSAKSSKGKVIVSFANVEKGLATKDGKAPNCFEVAADDKVFVITTAELKRNSLEVSSEKVKDIKYVRMGWQEIMVPNLMDKNGWPVFQFEGKAVK